MKIGIDCRLYHQTGVGVYIRNLIYYLQKIAPKEVEFYLYVLPNTKLPISNFQFQIRNADFKWHSFNEQIGFYRQLMTDNLDLMHFTYFSYPILYSRPFVITIHDLTPLQFKTGQASTHNHLTYNIKHGAYKFLINQAIKNSKAIITPTNFIKSQISLKFPNIPKSKIHVTHEGLNYELLDIKPNNDLKKQFPKPFFIYVGNFYPHKNIDNLIKAFASISNHKLILIGPNDYFSDKLKYFIDSLKLQHKIIFYNRASLSDLAYFYKNAQALIYPSLSEGFGLPAIEATYFKCPIIGSDIEVFQEVIGDNYYKFSPTDITSIEKAINDFINSPAEKLGPKLNPSFSFQQMSQKTLDIYLSSR